VWGFSLKCEGKLLPRALGCSFDLYSTLLPGSLIFLSTGVKDGRPWEQGWFIFSPSLPLENSNNVQWGGYGHFLQ